MEATIEPARVRTAKPLQGKVPLWAIVVAIVALQTAVVVVVPSLLRPGEPSALVVDR